MSFKTHPRGNSSTDLPEGETAFRVFEYGPQFGLDHTPDFRNQSRRCTEDERGTNPRMRLTAKRQCQKRSFRFLTISACTNKRSVSGGSRKQKTKARGEGQIPTLKQCGDEPTKQPRVSSRKDHIVMLPYRIGAAKDLRETLSIWRMESPPRRSAHPADCNCSSSAIRRPALEPSVPAGSPFTVSDRSINPARG